MVEVQEPIELVFPRDPGPQIPYNVPYLGGSRAQWREAPGYTGLSGRPPTDPASVMAKFSLHSVLPESREKPVFWYRGQPSSYR